MKTKFELVAPVEFMLSGANYDTKRITDAIQSELNRAESVGTELKRGDVKVKDDTKTAKGSVSFDESEKTKYAAKLTEPGRFAAWHDSLAAHVRKHGELSGELSATMIPAARLLWLAAFKAPTNPDGAETAKPAKGNRNGNGVGHVPTPAAPTA